MSSVSKDASAQTFEPILCVISREYLILSLNKHWPTLYILQFLSLSLEQALCFLSPHFSSHAARMGISSFINNLI